MTQKVYVRFGGISVLPADPGIPVPARLNAGISGYFHDDVDDSTVIKGVSTEEFAQPGSVLERPEARISFGDNLHEIKNKAIQALIWRFGYEAPHITITEHEMVFLNTDFS